MGLFQTIFPEISSLSLTQLFDACLKTIICLTFLYINYLLKQRSRVHSLCFFIILFPQVNVILILFVNTLYHSVE